MSLLKDLKISVFIPSYRRAGKVKTSNLFDEDDYTVVVRQSEEQEYRDYHKNVISFPDEEIDTLGKTRQKILDYAEGNVLQVDDDVKKFVALNEESARTLSKEETYAFIADTFQIVEDLGLSLWSLAPTPDVRKYSREFLFKGIVGTCMGFVGRKHRYDPKIRKKVDTDFFLQCMLYDRIIIIPNYFGVVPKMDLNKGGDNTNKNSVALYDAVESIKNKWPGIYSFNYERNVPKFNIQR